MACQECRRLHKSCDNKRPCNRCSRLNICEKCVDVEPKKRGRPRLWEKKNVDEVVFQVKSCTPHKAPVTTTTTTTVVTSQTVVKENINTNIPPPKLPIPLPILTNENTVPRNGVPSLPAPYIQPVVASTEVLLTALLGGLFTNNPALVNSLPSIISQAAVIAGKAPTQQLLPTQPPSLHKKPIIPSSCRTEAAQALNPNDTSSGSGLSGHSSTTNTRNTPTTNTHADNNQSAPECKKRDRRSISISTLLVDSNATDLVPLDISDIFGIHTEQTTTRGHCLEHSDTKRMRVAETI